MARNFFLISFFFVLFLSPFVFSNDMIDFSFPESIDYVFMVDRSLIFDYEIDYISDSISRAHICFFPESYFEKSDSFNDDYCDRLDLSLGSYSFNVRRNILLDDFYIPVFLSRNDKIVYDKIKIDYDYSHYPDFEPERKHPSGRSIGEQFELGRVYGQDRETLPARIISENEIEIETSSVSSVSRVRFRDLEFDDEIPFGIEMLDERGLGPEWSSRSKAQGYAIDPEELDFTSADVTIEAKGTEVHKCEDWDFENQRCLGEWLLLRDDLVPGEEYNITITPDDPGFVEYIEISKAYHLDETREIIDDVYDILKSLDGNTVTIGENEFVRVTFEENLTSVNDITIFAESEDLVSLEVYEKGTNTLVAVFDEIGAFGRYKEFLTDLEGEQDSFDIKVIGGSITIDHIIDPLTDLIENPTFVTDYDPWVLTELQTDGTSSWDSTNDLEGGSIYSHVYSNRDELLNQEATWSQSFDATDREINISATYYFIAEGRGGSSLEEATIEIRVHDTTDGWQTIHSDTRTTRDMDTGWLSFDYTTYTPVGNVDEVEVYMFLSVDSSNQEQEAELWVDRVELLFVPEEYELTVSESSGQGDVFIDSFEITVFPWSEIYTEDTVVDIEATPDTDWFFVEWLVDGSTHSTDEITTLTMDSDKTLQAVFDTRNLTVLESDGEGEVYINSVLIDSFPHEDNFGDNVEVEIEASPEIDWEFVEWLVNGITYSTDETTNITMDSDKTLQAVFSPPDAYDPPSVDTLAADFVTEESAQLRGELLDMGNLTEANLSFFWREVGSPSWNEILVEEDVTSPKEFSYSLSGLDEDTTYQFYAYAFGVYDGEDLEDSGEILEFSTGESLPHWNVITQTDWTTWTDDSENITIEGGTIFVDEVESESVDATDYCSVSGGDTDSYDEHMTNVQFNGIDRSSGNDGGYSDHTDSISDVLIPGETYTLSVTVETGGYAHYVSVVFDFNGNQDLTDETVIEVGTGSSEPQTVTTDITIPEDAEPGQTIMRVMQEYNEYHTDPCADQSYGETEDYTVLIGYTQGYWSSDVWDTTSSIQTEIESFNVFADIFSDQSASIRVGVDEDNNGVIDTWSNFVSLSDGDNSFDLETFGIPSGYRYAVDYDLETNNFDDSLIIHNYSLVPMEFTEVFVATRDSDDIGADSVTLNGELVEKGASDVDVFFRYREEGEVVWQETSVQTMSDVDTFDKSISGLEYDTTYEFRAVAQWDGQEARGAIFTFDTLNFANVETLDAVEIETDSALLRGELDLLNLGSVNVFFRWREKGQTDWIETDTQTITSTEDFNYRISGLSIRTDYEFKAVVNDLDDNEENIGEILEFTTLLGPGIWIVETQSDWVSATDTHYSTLVDEGALTLDRRVDIDVFDDVGSDTWDVPEGIRYANILIVAGGGGGAGSTGNSGRGGGGAGGLIFEEEYLLEEDNYSIQVGDGGAGGPSGGGDGSQGDDSSFGTLNAIGGGGGGNLNNDGGDGGSGGGAGVNDDDYTGGSGLQPTSTSGGFGEDGGGSGPYAVDAGGGGGGGADSSGGSGNADTGGSGGDGMYYGDIFGDEYGDDGWFAGGGGASAGSNVGLGGLGGGGDGSTNTIAPESGMVNTGGGGGGSQLDADGTGGSGGSGIVLISYGSPQISSWESIVWDASYDDMSEIESFDLFTEIFDDQSISFRIGVDENDDGNIDTWSDNLTLSDGQNSYGHSDFNLPNGFRYSVQFEFDVTDDSDLPRVENFSLMVRESCNFMISDCQELDEPGVYCLEDDILDVSINRCFDVTSNGVRLFGEGHHISGDGSSEYGVYLSRPSSEDSDFRIENLQISNFMNSNIFIENGDGSRIENVNITHGNEYGINLINSNNNLVTNLLSYDNEYGIYLDDSHSNIIEDSSLISNNYGLFSNSDNLTFIHSEILDSSIYGLSLDSNSQSTFYDNLFNNSNNLDLIEMFSHVWNTSLFPRTNIIGGSLLGGNVWSTPSQSGFSDKCFDGNDDGICDYPYDIFSDGSNIDNYPLAISTNTSWYAKYETFNGSTLDFNPLGFIGIQNVCNATLENTSYGKIEWLDCVNATSVDFDNYVSIGENYLNIDSFNLNPSFNSSANITLKNISLLDPVILKDGNFCDDCSIHYYDGENISFSINYSGNYSVVENYFNDDSIENVIYESNLFPDENQPFSLDYVFANLDEDDVYNHYDVYCYLDIEGVNYLMDYEGDGRWTYEDDSFNEGFYDFNITCNFDLSDGITYSSSFLVITVGSGNVSFESIGYNNYNVLSYGSNVYLNDTVDSFSGSFNTLHDFGDYSVFEELIDVDLLFSNFSYVIGLGFN